MSEEITIWTCYDDILSIYGFACSTIRVCRLLAAIERFWRPPIHEVFSLRQCGASQRSVNQSGIKTTCPDHQERHEASSRASAPACAPSCLLVFGWVAFERTIDLAIRMQTKYNGYFSLRHLKRTARMFIDNLIHTH